MDINLASLAGNLNASKRCDHKRKEAAPLRSGKGGFARMLVAMSVLLTVVGL